MTSFTASTRKPPAGGPGGTPRLGELLTELRRGEREGFVRYFRLFRSPVHDFTSRLLGDEAEAVAATNATFVAAFRRVILDDNVSDLWVVTCRCAFEACVDRANTAGTGGESGPASRPATPKRGRGATSASAGFEAGLQALSMRRRAALLLHDRCGLSLAQMAAVFAVGEEAAGALLIRAREDFREAFDEHCATARSVTCRQAEQAAAGAVGLGLGADALRRLRRHAAYCRPCRTVMKTWGDGPVGLALLLARRPLPESLATPPVFGAELDGVAAVAAAGVVGRGLRSLRDVLRSRAAAYAVAAACMALAAGLVLHQGQARTLFFAESIGPAIRLVVQPPADVNHSQKQAASSKSPRPSSASSQSASVSLASSAPVQMASEPVVATTSAGAGAAAGSRAHSATTSTGKASGRGSVARTSSAAPGPASRAAHRAAARHRHFAHRHFAHRHFAHRHLAHRHLAHRHLAHRHLAHRHLAHRHSGIGSRSSRHGTGRHYGHRARTDRHGNGAVHRASGSHRTHGTWSHASGSQSRSAHAHGWGGHHGHRHSHKH